MNAKYKMFMNIYVVGSLIAIFVLLYFISFVVIEKDIDSGSSLKIHKEELAKEHKAMKQK